MIAVHAIAAEEKGFFTKYFLLCLLASGYINETWIEGSSRTLHYSYQLNFYKVILRIFFC